jgi:taurine dioxygenase
MKVTSFTLEQVTGTIGARVGGLNIRDHQSAAVGEDLQRALHEHGVLFFSLGDPASDDDHKSLGHMFGEVHQLPLKNGGDPELITFDSDVPTKYTADHWHTDGTPDECPAGAALLRCVVLPPVGGDTLWASMYAAYESLSSHYQRLLEGLQAVHSRDVGGRVLTQEGGAGDVQSSSHPVVLLDPVTGRKALYVNSLYTERIVGMTDRESKSVLSMLYEHVNTPDFHVRLRWAPDTIAVWEERITQHRMIPDHNGRRVMRRLQIVGQAPAKMAA